LTVHINSDVLVNTLDLTSFVLATPEIIGEQRIEKIGEELRAALAFLRARPALYRIAGPVRWLTKYLWRLYFTLITLGLSLGIAQHILPLPYLNLLIILPAAPLFVITAVLLPLLPFIILLRLLTLAETIANRSRMSRIMLILGVLLFFCSRVLAIVHALNHGD
jgi:hypothetical protein